MFDVVTPRKRYQLPKRIDGIDQVKMQLLFGCSNVAVGTLQNGQEQVVFVAIVVIKKPFIDACALSDSVDPSARKTVFCEFVSSGIENGRLSAFCVARDWTRCCWLVGCHALILTS